MQKTVHQIYSFDEFTLDLTRGCLLRGNTEEIKLRPKSFEVLRYLAENGGRLVTKDELIEAVWTDTAVTDDSLVQCLKDIRRALDDKSQTFIKTVPRRGYIFEKDVSENGGTIYTEETAGVHLVIEETEWSRGEEEKRKSGAFVNAVKQNKRTAIFVLASLVVIAAVVGWRFYSNQSDKINAESSPPMSALLFQNTDVKSITHVGNIINNAISPDGKYVVYTTGDAGRESLWLRQIATDSTHSIIVPADARYFGVTFSRDGNYIFYLRAENNNRNLGTLYRIPTLGSVPEKVLADMDWCPTFSPDGRQMAFVRSSEALNESVLMIADADGANERRLAVRSLNEAYDFPAWSSDGKIIAASAGSVELGDSFRDVVTVNVADGTEKTITRRKWYWIDKVAWLADGSGLIMSANPQKSHVHNQLWLLSYPTGEARQITSDSHNYTNVSLTADSHVLLAGHTELLTHLWIAPEGDAVRARRISSGLGAYKHIRWNSDGKLIVSALGNNNIDIYLRGADGAETKQLTVNAGTNWGQEVSHDNRYIVFDSDRTGDFHIWRMDADGGNPTQLTNGNGEKFADISPDGKWVIYTAFQDWTLWKISIEGGEPVKIAENYARQSAISPDGKWIVYMASENNCQIVMPFEGNSPVKTFDLPSDAPQLQPVRWSPTVNPSNSSSNATAWKISGSSLWMAVHRNKSPTLPLTISTLTIGPTMAKRSLSFAARGRLIWF